LERRSGRGMRMFVEFQYRVYRNGGYINAGIAFAENEIARVIECNDDYSCTNIVTKDGKVFTISMLYNDVMKKIFEARANDI